MGKSRHSVRRRRRSRRKSKRQNLLRRNLFGKVSVLIELLLSCVFVGTLWYSGLVPVSYLIGIAAALLVLTMALLGLQFVHSKIYIAGIVVSILISMVLAVGIFYVIRTSQMMSDVGGAEYKTDNMVVVVRVDDPAQSLADAADYTFGTQDSLDQENT